MILTGHQHTHHRHRGHTHSFGPRGGFGGEGFGRFGYGGRGEGRGRRVFDGGDLRLVLLKLIADEPRHGYDLIRAIEERSGGAYAPSPGVIYPSITMLEDMGLIAEQPSEGAKRRFAATAEGEAHLADRAEQVAALFARLDALGDAARRSDVGPIRRAMGNLHAVVRGAAERGQQDVGHQIAEILDEAARRIERL